MADVNAAIANFERNIEAQSGKSVAAWIEALREIGAIKHGEMVAWLKAEHGLSHAQANHIGKRALDAAAPRSTEDPLGHMFGGDKDALRPLVDHLIQACTALGPDVEIAPKKANISVRRRKQFALIQPTTRTRVDLGLILKDRSPLGRLEPSGSFNAMFTHRVKLASIDDIDSEVRGWLQDAYDAA